MAAKKNTSGASFRQAEEASKAKQKQSARKDSKGRSGMGSTAKKPTTGKYLTDDAVKAIATGKTLKKDTNLTVAGRAFVALGVPAAIINDALKAAARGSKATGKAVINTRLTKKNK